MTKFTIRLSELIKDSGKTQKEIAKNLNLTQNQLHYYVKGKAEPSIEILIQLANYFNVCIDYLVGRQDWY